ncbi:MAG: prepilin-type N-terminal cleavage/methylation domain-containing protein [Elusimicrobia bacterium]|nr:prepilin-type N-terminal cleavage/methylation domain-containing protein [Elusimicrobiota bacterium]
MKRTKAFTLVEMVITIAIIIVLSSISVPIYKSYTEKAALAEGYALLGTIRSSQENYYAEYGCFLENKQSSIGGVNGSTCYDSVLNINARTNRYFTVFVLSSWDQGGPSEIFSANKGRYQMAPIVKGLINGTIVNLALVYNITTGLKYYKGEGSWYRV